MYFPYLRGKQFDLIALKDSMELLIEKRDKVSPIIEPVKNAPTLQSTISDLALNNINFNIVVNPSIGDFKTNPSGIFSTVERILYGYNPYQVAILVDASTDYERLLTEILRFNLRPQGFTFIHNDVHDNIIEIQRNFARFYPIINNVINFKKTNRRYDRKFPKDTKVSLDDYFICQPKNADYLGKESQFSEEHLYYADEGFKGFSDFLTVGEAYSDSGGQAFAVAIHISYLNEDRTIRIKHFVSDSNKDAKDLPRKFDEANTKLVNWCDQYNLKNKALDKFRDYKRLEHFPGLGTVKKLSIMNHLELVLNLI